MDYGDTDINGGYAEEKGDFAPPPGFGEPYDPTGGAYGGGYGGGGGPYVAPPTAFAPTTTSGGAMNGMSMRMAGGGAPTVSFSGGGFQPFPQTQNIMAAHYKAPAKLVSETAAEAFAKDVTNDINWCYHLMLHYGLSPTEVILVIVRYRESVLKQFMSKEGQFSRAVEDAWIENKISSLPKPEGEGESQEIARQMDIIQSFQRDIISEGTRMRDLCKQGVAQVQKPLNEWLKRLKTVADSLVWLASRLPNKELSIDQQTALREWTRLVDQLIVRNQSLVHFVSIFGLEKAGKTTTLCAWLRDALLPTAKYRCTFVPNSLHSSTSPIIWARVYVRGAKEFRERLMASVAKKDIDLEMLKMESKKLMNFEDAARYIEDRSADALRTVGPYFDIKEADESRARQRLNEYVATYTLSFVTVRVEVYTPQLQIKDGVEWGFCDLAGTDSPHPEHHEQAHKQIQNSEAFILCKAGERPALLGPEMELIKSVKERDPKALAKAFAFITRLDSKDAGEVNALVKQGTDALVAAGFSPGNIFVLCPFYHLTKHRLEKDAKQVSQQDRETYEHIGKTSVPEVLNGFDKAQLAVETYVKQSLPMKRVDDGVALAEQLRPLIHYVCDGVTVVAPTVATAVQELRKNRRNQFELIWTEEFTKLTEDAAEANYGHMIVEREQRKAEVRKRYQDTLRDRFGLMKKKFDSIPPRKRIARAQTFNTGVDVHAVEKKCREEQLAMFITSIDVITQDLCALVDKNVQEYGRHLTTVFTNTYRVDTTEIFDCSKLVPTEDCRCQIHSLLMRCAYPLGLSVLRWPHTVMERREAVVVLADISPMAASQVVHALPGAKEEKGLPSGRKPDPEGPNNAQAPGSNKRAPPNAGIPATPPAAAARTTSGATPRGNPAAAAAAAASTPPATETRDGSDPEITAVGTPIPRTRFAAAGGAPGTATAPVAIPAKR